MKFLEARINISIDDVKCLNFNELIVLKVDYLRKLYISQLKFQDWREIDNFLDHYLSHSCPSDQYWT